MLKGKRIILGVTGGIAAYKVPLLVRLLKKSGAEVNVVMTASAVHFVSPETLAALSGNDVIVDTFPAAGSVVSLGTWHVKLGQASDLMMIAPATANTIAKLAYGMADNAVTMLALALRCPMVLSPAMDVDMWHHPATRQNLEKLREYGYTVLPPETGELASGLFGEGRMPEAENLLVAIRDILTKSKQDLSGKKILITAGPTQEPIDPVRFLTNRSSGKMGFALAHAAALRGADVTLIAGPVHLETPRNIQRINVESASQMFDAVMKHRKQKDAVIMAAAVADYTPETVSSTKIKKNPGSEGLTMSFKKTRDILYTLGKEKTGAVLVGFALETDNDIFNAKKKLLEKNLRMVVLNNATEEGAGFGGDTNIITILPRKGKMERLPKMSKFDAANAILDRVVKAFKQ